MFNKSALAVVIASAFALPAHADIKNVDIYGQIAISAWTGADWATVDANGGYENPIKIENESRIGFRGSKDFANGPKFIWQIESGNVGESGGDGKLGVRDTFGGFEWEGIGKVRAGRMLTPLYEVLDWPYSSISTGKVMDWRGDIIGGGNYDRQSNMIRFDSANHSGFSYNLALGRGNNTNDASSNFYGLGAHYNTGPLTLHATYEKGTDRKIGEGAFHGTQKLAKIDENNENTANALLTHTSGTGDSNAYLLGFELNFDNGLGFYGAYKRLTADYSDMDLNVIGVGTTTLNGMSQDSYTLATVYNTGLWQFKLAYAANLKPEFETAAGDFKASEFSDSIISGQAMYFLDDSAVAYVRPYYLQRRGLSVVQDGDKEFGLGMGVEYYF
ncbi:porin [Aeromonas sp. 102P]|uniref:porin n=1 Tax=Aeromonas sp. 102P TaxID=3452711 RepID=UPI003F793732